MYQNYVVLPGDSIASIARQYAVSPELIKVINNKKADGELVVGEMLIIPLPMPMFDYYVIKKGDTLYNLGQKYQINYIDLAKINGLKPEDFIYENQVIFVPKEGVKIYLTQVDDTIKSVEDKTGKGINQLMLQNQRIFLLPEQLIAYREN